jgi:hypothetical protein
MNASIGKGTTVPKFKIHETNQNTSFMPEIGSS